MTRILYRSPSIALAFLTMLFGFQVCSAQEVRAKSSDLLRAIIDVDGYDVVEASAGGQPIFSYADIDDVLSKLNSRNVQIGFLKELIDLVTENRRTNRRRYYAIQKIFGPKTLLGDSLAVFSAGRLCEKFHLERDEQTRSLIQQAIRHLVTSRQEIFRSAFNLPTASGVNDTVDFILGQTKDQ